MRFQIQYLSNRTKLTKPQSYNVYAIFGVLYGFARAYLKSIVP